MSFMFRVLVSMREQYLFKYHSLLSTLKPVVIDFRD